MEFFTGSHKTFCADLPTEPIPEIGTVLVAGASGYIGGRLVPELLARGYRVRVMVRAYSPEYATRWPGAEVCVADALNPEQLKEALKDVAVAYYLIHSLLRGLKSFKDADRKAAENFRQAAEKNNVQRIIYLGALGDTHTELSPHLFSRFEVGQELCKGEIPVTILRAAVIIGSGSASYEIIHHLILRIPLFILPRWAKTKCQPIGVRDVIKYLVGVLELKETMGQVFDIGGRDVLTYEDMFKDLAQVLGRKCRFCHGPVSSIRFYAYITNLLTPVPAPIAYGLMTSIRNEMVCKEDRIRQYLPFAPLSCEEAFIRAVSREREDLVHSRWSDSYPPNFETAPRLDEMTPVPEYGCSYSVFSTKSEKALFESFMRVGGKHGWFHSNYLWRLRGWIDRVLTGVGTVRGRRSTGQLRMNDAIDFWRVEDLQPNRRLLLRAEMKLPGQAWLEFTVYPERENINRLTVIAHYQAHGFWGRLYWNMLVPLHHIMFNNLVRKIEQAAVDAD